VDGLFKTLTVVTVALLLAIASASPSVAMPADDVAVVQSGDPSDGFDVQLFDLAAVRRLFQALARQRSAMTDGEQVAAWADFSLMTEAITGEPAEGLPVFDIVETAVRSGVGLRVRAARGVTSRDGAASLLLAVGYSARETADVVSGRIGRSALDTAELMIAAGQGRDAAANYLDSQYAGMRAIRDRQNAPPVRGQRGSSGPFDDLIERYASMHAVESALVRAIIQVESAFNPRARSHAGAVGLMQLMPGTARELGVDPFVPAQNIEGGVRYLSQLLKRFGAVDVALVAYNAGPGFAERYLRGQATLYGETRQYVTNVLARRSALR
jgi:hypothetical protein